MSESEINKILKEVEKAMEMAEGNEEEEARLIDTLVDPQDALNCEGCQ